MKAKKVERSRHTTLKVQHFTLLFLKQQLVALQLFLARGGTSEETLKLESSLSNTKK